MRSYRTTDELDQPLWDAFVNSSPSATSYHLYAWRRVIERSFGHKTHYLAALDNAGAVKGVLPLVHMKSNIFGNFLISVPFVNYGGILAESDGASQALLERAQELRASCGAEYVELRHLGFGFPGIPSKEQKVTMVLPLAQDAESQWAAFNAKLRNQVRKAGKSGLRFVMGQQELLDDFYTVFARNMRDLGTPVYAKEFFYNVLTILADRTRIVAVRHEGKTIAAGILYWYRDTIEMPWASSIADYKAMCPNNMLYWEAIRFAIDLGCSRFDFGRSTPNEGTYNFKKQWGAEPIQLYWQYLLNAGNPLPQLNNKNPKFEMATKTWQKLPLWLTNLVGPGIVRNIP